MGKFILKINDDKTKKDYYLEWSTIIDAPTTYGMDFEAFKEYYLNKYGESSSNELTERLSRVEKYGSSGKPPFDKLDDFFELNRAGENESSISKDEIIKRYCIERN